MKASKKQIFASVVFSALILLYTSIVSFASYKGSTQSLGNKTSLFKVMSISYHPNGTAGGDINEVAVCSGDAKLRANTFTRTGYSFNGWNTKADGSGTSYADNASLSGIPGSSLDLYAKWNVINYGISYNLNSGTYPGLPASYNVESAAITLETPTRAGYTFTGWTGTGISTPQATVTIAHGSTGDRAYTANWTANTDTRYAVSHQLERLDGTFIIHDTEFLTGTTDTSVTPAVKSFPGFIPPETQTVTIKGNGSTVVTYLYRRNSYAVTVINGTGVTTTSGGGSYKYGQSVTVKCEALNPGYNFGSWTGGKTGNEATLTFTMPSNDISVTAIGTPIEYSISYTLNGGSINGQATSYTVETATFNLKKPTKEGYTFTGWTGEGITTPQETVTITQGSIGNRTYTANWTANTNTQYKVYHRQQGLDGNYTTYETQNLTGTTGANVTPATKSYTGFKSPSTQTITISADGNASVTYNYERLSYNVSVSNGAGISSVSGGGSKKYGESVTVSCTPSSGYNFGSWTATGISAGTTASFSFTMPNNNVTLQAVGSAKNYTISYTLNGGSITGQATSYTVETATFNLKKPTKTGYTFTGWTGEGITTPQETVTITQGSIGNRTYTANWTANTNTPYKVYHRQQGLDGNYTTYETQNLTGTTGASVTPATKSYTGFKSPSTQAITISADGNASVTYDYERLSYNVTVSNGAGISSVSGGGTKKYGESVTVSCTPSSGYNFGSWTATGISAGTTASFSFTMPNNNVTLQAVGSAISYTISYTLNGGSITGEPTSYTIESPNITLPTPMKSGFSFTGWTGSGISSPQMTVTITHGSTGNKSYTANWESASASYTVYHRREELNGNFITYETENLTGTAGASVTPATKSYTGFTSPSTQTITINANGSSTVTYDYYRKSYSVSVSQDTGISSVSGGGSKKYGESVTVSCTPGSGYNFGNWTATGISAGTTASFTFNMPDNNVTLKAKGSAIVYTITYNLNGGSISGETTSYTVETPTFQLKTPTKSGNTFAGWTGTGLSSAQTPVTITQGSIGNRSYTANWTTSSFFIHYFINGGSLDGNKVTYTEIREYSMSQLPLTLPMPTHEAGYYTFKGWTWDGHTTPQKTVTLTSASVESGMTYNYYAHYDNGGKTILLETPFSVIETWGAVGAKTIKRSATLPSGVTTEEIQEAGEKVYAWVDDSDSDNITVYYYSTASTIYMNYQSYSIFDGWSLKNVQLDLNTSYVVDMEGMFRGCTELENLNLSNFNTSRAKNMKGMFDGCTSLATLNISSFNTSNVTDMSEMFKNCPELTSLDLSSFNTSNVITMYDMFNSCSNLRTIYVSTSFTTNALDSSEGGGDGMFLWDDSLVGGNGTAYADAYVTDETYACIDTPSTPGYFTKKTGTNPTGLGSANSTLFMVSDDEVFVAQTGKSSGSRNKK